MVGEPSGPAFPEAVPPPPVPPPPTPRPRNLRRRSARYIASSLRPKNPVAVAAISGVRIAVFTVTAASHPDASAFLTPYEDIASANEAASPTSNARPSAKVDEVYMDALTAQAGPTGRAGVVIERMSEVRATSASNAAVRSAAPSMTSCSSGSNITAT